MSHQIGQIAAFVIPLALDTLAFSIAVGLRGGVAPLRVALVCGIFEGTMPAVGAAFALAVPPRFTLWAVYVGAALLIAVGVHTLCEASADEHEAESLHFTSLRSMVLAGFAISTDELVAGFPLAAGGLPVAPTLVVIAIQSFLVGYVGVAFGRRLGRAVERFAGFGAGIAFIALGGWLALEHLHAQR